MSSFCSFSCDVVDCLASYSVKLNSASEMSAKLDPKFKITARGPVLDKIVSMPLMRSVTNIRIGFTNNFSMNILWKIWLISLARSIEYFTLTKGHNSSLEGGDSPSESESLLTTCCVGASSTFLANFFCSSLLFKSL